jgi:lipoprotein-anchoring transpeptidase ErfK/SrfK
LLPSSWLIVALAVASAVGLAAGRAAHTTTQAEQRRDAAVEYRVEEVDATTRDLARRFTPAQIAILEKLNRADAAHLRRQEYLVVPSVWTDGELPYSPFPPMYPAAAQLLKLLVIDQPAQTFAAYDNGRLVRWGPVSSGQRTHATPSGVFYLNWRSRGRHSTVNPRWYLRGYFNFDNTGGLALHAYELPGYPASHGCVRLLARDAIWIHDWGDGWTLDRRGEIFERGTPLLIVGQYDFDAPPPWRSLEYLSQGIRLPSEFGEHSVVKVAER